MTTEPKNELPGFHKGFRPCKQCEYTAPPELKKSERKHFDAHVFECTRCLWTPEAMPTLDKARDAWNARPAKAVQGDKKREDDLKAHRINGFDALIRIYQILPPIKNKEVHKQLMEELEYISKTLDQVLTLAALTPESEGIAGKGEALSLLRIWRREKNLPHKTMVGVTLTEDKVLDAVESALSTLARPQEIDVEGIKDRVADIMESAFEGDDLGDVARDISNAVIDHLAASGYLSAPDGKAQEPCDDCQGTGEVFTHRMDCHDDLCALNGDIHSCTGVAVPCSCAAAAPPVTGGAEYDLSKCPKCQGEADNGHDRCIPPTPYLCTKCAPPSSQTRGG